jgi:hypothetical protein
MASHASAVPLTGIQKVLVFVDMLMHPPHSLYLQFKSTKSVPGGIATLLIVIMLGVIFAVIYLANSSIPDVSQSFIEDLTQSPPLMLQVSCTSRDSHGNTNPFCPAVSGDAAARPAGFQFVASIADTVCQRSIARVANRTASQPWLDPSAADAIAFTSPAILHLEEYIGVPAEEIAGDADPFQLISFSDLAKDMSISPQVTRVQP